MWKIPPKPFTLKELMEANQMTYEKAHRFLLRAIAENEITVVKKNRELVDYNKLLFIPLKKKKGL